MTLPILAASTSASDYWVSPTRSWATVLPTYWEATGQPHRQALLAALAPLAPFKELREVGCCAGTNLRMIRDRYSDIRLEGVEISTEAAAFAQAKFDRDPMTGIVCADVLDEAPLWPDGDTDITITCFTLAHIHPDEVPKLVGHMLRASRRAVIIVEPIHGPIGQFHHIEMSVWRHDYVGLLRELLPRTKRPCKLEGVSVPNPIHFCDGVITVTFN